MKLSVIEEIAREQKEALLMSDSGLRREALDFLPNIESHALIISGIRRCGKSTLLHQYLQQKSEDFFYLLFEDVRLYDFQMKDFALLDKIIEHSKQKLLFFDEIQSVKGWELYVRQKLDQQFKVIITGSNASLLSRELGTKLTGRHITKELFPFSFSEFIAFKTLTPSIESLEKYMYTGGFPEFAKNENLETLKMLIDDILYRDIVVRYGIKDASSVKRLLSYLFFNVAKLTSPSKLTDIAGVKSSTTVLEYFSYFEDSYLISLLPKFSYSAKSQMLSPKKVYVSDTGLIRAGAILLTENYGYFLENLIFIHLRRQTKELFYFNENNHECDFVQLENGKIKSLLQVCWELNTDNEEREIDGLLNALNYFNLTRGTIITANQQDTIYHGGLEIEVVPAWKFLYTRLV
ncbi:MAG: ATP-binding protein [Dysgonamonadaceae bacterium]|jgi:predicted AAA+ superfamily ATPase|nr:ATP-binding protein [Dysgonamonadaceae bacterium]